MLALLLAVQASSAPAPPSAVPATAFDRAVQCHAYGQMMPSLVDPAIGARIRDYWMKRSLALGKKQGRSAEQVADSVSAIDVESEDAIAIVVRCIRATPRSVTDSKVARRRAGRPTCSASSSYQELS